jgi:hypothetical protein
MKKLLSLLLLAGAASTPARAALLWMDNFDVPDAINNFDGASLTGRLSGSESGNTTFRSWGFQQSISNGQLLMPVGGNGVRFGGQTTRFNWAGGTSGPAILLAGGFVITFDWIPQDNTDNEWVSFQVGTINNDNGNLTDDDYGILFRNNGGTERFDNNVNLGAGSSFIATANPIPRRIEITYSFTSFADGSPVNVISKVDGFTVAADNFTWDSNGGEMRMEMGNGVNNTRIDNFSVATIVPEPGSALLLAGALGLMARRRRAW